MIRIYDALKQNDMDRIKDTFSAIDGKYSKHTYVSSTGAYLACHITTAGTRLLRDSSTTCPDIIDDIENSKDLSAAALGYIGIGLAFAFAVPAADF